MVSPASVRRAVRGACGDHGRGGGFAEGCGVEGVEEPCHVGDIHADLLYSTVRVTHHEFAVAEARRGAAVGCGESGQDRFVADVGRYAQQAQRLGGDLGVFGDAADEDGGDEVLDVEAEDVFRVLGGDQGREVPFAGVAGQADQERSAGAPAFHEV